MKIKTKNSCFYNHNFLKNIVCLEYSLNPNSRGGVGGGGGGGVNSDSQPFSHLPWYNFWPM